MAINLSFHRYIIPWSLVLESRGINSFREAAKEAAMSRLYGGIHYRFDNEKAIPAGKKLGEFLVQRLKLKK